MNEKDVTPEEIKQSIDALEEMWREWLRNAELKHLSADEKFAAYTVARLAFEHKTRLIKLGKMLKAAEAESEELDRKVELINPAIKLAIRKQKADEKAAS